MNTDSSPTGSTPAAYPFGVGVLHVQPEHHTQRLDKVLGTAPELTSRAAAQRLLEQGRVFGWPWGTPVPSDEALSELLHAWGTTLEALHLEEEETEGEENLPLEPPHPQALAIGQGAKKCSDWQLLFFAPTPALPTEITPEEGPLSVLYEDDDLIVVNKPAGLAVHPGAGRSKGTLVHRLVAHCGKLSTLGGAFRPGVVHRLDMDTSGVLVVAKTDHAHSHLSTQFSAHTIQRKYIAITIGVPTKPEGKVDLPLGRHAQHRLKQGVIKGNGGRRAVTHWRKLDETPPFALVRCQLETGRTHQIRVHMAEQGWPLLGDPLYGGNRLKGFQLDGAFNAEAIDRLNQLERQALHAQTLGFEHPTSGKMLRFYAPPPQDLLAIMDDLFPHRSTGGSVAAAWKEEWEAEGEEEWNEAE